MDFPIITVSALLFQIKIFHNNIMPNLYLKHNVNEELLFRIGFVTNY